MLLGGSPCTYRRIAEKRGRALAGYQRVSGELWRLWRRTGWMSFVFAGFYIEFSGSSVKLHELAARYVHRNRYTYKKAHNPCTNFNYLPEIRICT